MAKKTTEKTKRDIGNIQVKSATALWFKELKEAHAEEMELGEMSNNQFMNRLLASWSRTDSTQFEGVEGAIDNLQAELAIAANLTPQQLEELGVDLAKKKILLEGLQKLQRATQRINARGGMPIVKAEQEPKQ